MGRYDEINNLVDGIGMGDEYVSILDQGELKLALIGRVKEAIDKKTVSF